MTRLCALVLSLSLLPGCGSGGDDSKNDPGSGGTASGGTSGNSGSGGSSTGGTGTGGSNTGGSNTGGGGGRLPPPSGPLEGLPSEAGPHVATIEALGDGAWTSLGTPTADPTFGVARGRSWGGRALVSASALRGAFYTGEGKHAFVKPDGYGMDDIFFYDINQNRWIAVYPGMHTQSFNQRVQDGELLIDDNGQLVDADAQPIPMHTLIHAWDFLTFDPAKQKFVFLAGNGMGRYYLPGEAAMEEGLTALEAVQATKTAPPMSPWFYDITTAKFEHSPITTELPLAVENWNTTYGVFDYLPTQQRYFYGSAEGVSYYDPASLAWSVANDSGPRPTGYDVGGCYDEKRDRMYVGAGDGSGFHIYDLATETWSKSASGGAPGNLGTNVSSVLYDVANDVVTVLQYDAKAIFVYSPSANSWSSTPMSSEMLSSVSGPRFNAFYDAQINAYFVHAAGDSEDNGMMWVYRYKKP
jgi:hypothetical protein